MTRVAASALTRRAFIRTTAAAGGGLMLGVSTACGDRGGVGPALAGAASAAPEASFSPNVFVHLHTSGEVEIVVAHSRRSRGESKYSIGKLLRLQLDAMATLRSARADRPSPAREHAAIPYIDLSEGEVP